MLLYKRKNQEYGIFRYAVLFSEIEGRLKKLSEKYNENMRFDVMGHSNEGRELFLVTLAKDVSDSWLDEYSKQRLNLLSNPGAALSGLDEKNCPPLPILLNCNLHGTEISGTDGMFTFIDEVLGGDKKEQYLNDAVILISICLNPDGRSRGLDILNGHGVDLNRDWMAQTQPETRALITGCLKKYYPIMLVDLHGFMASANILIDACTPPHNPFAEYDLLESHLLNNSLAMAAEIKKRTNLDTDIPAEIWEDGWEDYSPVYTTGYFLINGSITHTVELHFPSEEGAYAAHCCGVGVLNYVNENKLKLYKDQCEFYKRGIENKKDNEFHTDYYILDTESNKPAVLKTVEQMIFNKISVYLNENGDYVVPLAQPLRPLIHNMLWSGEDISDSVKSFYDVSFYSYPVMRGFNVRKADKDSSEVQNLQEVSETKKYFPLNLIKEAGRNDVRILVVSESGMTDEILTEMGYNVHMIPFSELNTGHRISPSQYDIFVVGGSKTLLWEDAFDDYLGIGYHNSWGLRERGRQEVLDSALQFKNLILFGYGGMRVNENISRIAANPLFMEGADGKPYDLETGKYAFYPPNGSFRLSLTDNDPLCAGYKKEEVFYFVAPVAYESADAEISMRFTENSFINGFNMDKKAMDGHIAAFHKTAGEYKTVIFGFDPIYRGYTDHSYNMLKNAVELVRR